MKEFLLLLLRIKKKKKFLFGYKYLTKLDFFLLFVSKTSPFLPQCVGTKGFLIVWTSGSAASQRSSNISSLGGSFSPCDLSKVNISRSGAEPTKKPSEGAHEQTRRHRSETPPHTRTHTLPYNPPLPPSHITSKRGKQKLGILCFGTNIIGWTHMNVNEG